MNNTIDVTEKLLKIVRNRKTPILVNKQENAYKKSRSSSKNLSYDSYSSDSGE